MYSYTHLDTSKKISCRCHFGAPESKIELLLRGEKWYIIPISQVFFPINYYPVFSMLILTIKQAVVRNDYWEPPHITMCRSCKPNLRPCHSLKFFSSNRIRLQNGLLVYPPRSISTCCLLLTFLLLFSQLGSQFFKTLCLLCVHHPKIHV